MKIKLLVFGIATDLLKTQSTVIKVSDNCSVKRFKEELVLLFPELKNINSYAIAVNENYANGVMILKENDVVAIIPPVSGG